VGALDARVFRLLHEGLSGSYVQLLMAALTIVGSGWTMLAFVPLLTAARTRRVGVSLVATLVATSIVVALLKRAVGRARPCACLEGIHARVFAAPTDFSFPSGHAAGAFAFAAFVSVLLLRAPDAAERRAARWLSALALFGLAVGIALSRVALGVHFPGDVGAGAALGASLGALGATIHLRRRAASK
jgi:undecaprenyl-diphosphatase